MSFIKCPKCGREEPSFDYAHVGGPRYGSLCVRCYTYGKDDTEQSNL